MPKNITPRSGLSASSVPDTTITVPETGDTSSATRQEAAIQKLLDNDAILIAKLEPNTLAALLGGTLTGWLNKGAIADGVIDAAKLGAGAGAAGTILQRQGSGSNIIWVTPISITTGTGLDGADTPVDVIGGSDVTLSIQDGGVDTTQLAADAVDASKLDTSNAGTAGQVLQKGSGDQMTWGTGGGAGDITQVIAGTGLSGGGVTGAVTVNIANDGVTNTLIADDAVDTDQIADDAVDTSQIADDAVDASKLDTSNTGSSGQILQKTSSDQMTWVAKPAAGVGDITEVRAGTGLTGGSTSGVATLSIANDGVGSAQIASGAVGSSEIASGAVGSSELAANSVTQSAIRDGSVHAEELSPGQSTSHFNKFLKYNNSNNLEWADVATGATVSWTAARQSGSTTGSERFHNEQAYKFGNLVFYSGIAEFSTNAGAEAHLIFNVPTGTPAANQYGVAILNYTTPTTTLAHVAFIRTQNNGTLRISLTNPAATSFFAYFTGWYVL